MTPDPASPQDTGALDTGALDIGALDIGALADSVAAAALSVPGVIRLHTGAFGEVSTYLAGRRVDGVRLGSAETEVHVVLAPYAEIQAAAAAIRAAVGPLVGTEVAVFIEDLDTGPTTGDH